MAHTEKHLNRSSLLVGAGIVGVFLLLIWSLWGMLTPFLTAFLMAYILKPLVGKLEKKGVPRWLTSLVLMVGFFAFIFQLFFILVPFVERQLFYLFDAFPVYMDRMSRHLEPLWEIIKPYTRFQGDRSPFQDVAAAPLKDALKLAFGFLSGLLNSGGALISFLTLLFFAPLMTFHFLRDWDRVLTHAEKLVPRKALESVRDLVGKMDDALGNYARGQFIVCSLLAVYYIVALYWVGFSFALTLGFVTGFLIFIPYVGFFIGLLLSLGVGLVSSEPPFVLMGIAVVYAFGQMFEGVFLTPIFVGGRTGLHPLWILFSLFASGALLGLVGVIFCLPLAAVSRVLVSWCVARYQTSSYYLGRAAS